MSGLILSLTACATSQEFISIDYLEPAPVTLPKETNHIAFLDHQPEDASIEGSEILKFTGATRAEIIKGLINSLAEQSYFDQITILETKWIEPNRDAPSMSSLEKITSSVQPDLIVILSGLNAKDEDFVVESENLTATSVVSIQPKFYFYNTDTKKASVYQPKDTVNLMPAILLTTIHPSVAERLENIEHMKGGNIMGNQLASHLIPHWKSDDRMLFTDTPHFKKSTSLFNENKLPEAIEANIAIYENEKSTVANKAKAANNIAMLYELQDNLQTALEWNQIALQILEQNSASKKDFTLGSTGDLYKFTKAYNQTIQKRVNSIKLINDQMSKFEL